MLSSAYLLGWLRRRYELPTPFDWVLWATQIAGLFIAVLAMVEWTTGFPVQRVGTSIRDALSMEITTLGSTSVTPVTILTVLCIFAASWWASGLVRNAVIAVLVRRRIGDQGSVAALARLLQYFVMGAGVVVGLELLGLNLSTLLTAGAVFAVGIGLAMQKVAENFVSGVILLVEQSIRPGDILEVDGRLVRVQHLGIRATVARTLDDEELILPNSLLVQTTVKNLRLSDTFLRVRLAVGVSYGSNIEKTFEALREAVATMPETPGREPVVVMVGFGASSVDFEVSAWTSDPWRRQGIRSELALAVWEALQAAEIEISFPQLDVHLDPEVVRGLSRQANDPPGQQPNP